MEITCSKPSTDQHGFLSIVPPPYSFGLFAISKAHHSFFCGNLPSLKPRYPLNFENWWKLEVESWGCWGAYYSIYYRGLPSLKLTVRLKMVVSKFGIAKLPGSPHFQGWILRWLRCMYCVGRQHYWSPGPYGVLDRGRCWTKKGVLGCKFMCIISILNIYMFIFSYIYIYLGFVNIWAKYSNQTAGWTPQIGGDCEGIHPKCP